MRTRSVFRGPGVPVALVLSTLLLGGCAGQLKDLGREPRMSAVGEGLRPVRTTIPTETFAPMTRKDYNSLWVADRNDFFRDPRARKVGDVLTVKIAIDDKAELDNTSDRAKSSSTDVKLGGSYNTTSDSGSGDISGGTTSGSSSTGQGSIDRSEEIVLKVAAVVTERLPNGNMLISGSQEVRVNYEMRILHVAGIVRPRDIAGDNTIEYDKIAEARISYGGRGRISEVQQPGWGQQLFDIVNPF
ncbi:flagellar L-ring protein precursor FlgH [Breoghania corrubedonensis]|uniref:Flagellar L-ring protein n=1 Tax=Breoghania corrubedonensis TaxID=665038 RepID=A0A2T5V8S2_9HYPH|nr:flagellar basal body L-ring protein FlgH [Breoghania corrubedonensis]PTW60152.1 flagellar L-ring protein precursor FlgH [Breoghania corrubedonensis]